MGEASGDDSQSKTSSWSAAISVLIKTLGSQKPLYNSHLLEYTLLILKQKSGCCIATTGSRFLSHLLYPHEQNQMLSQLPLVQLLLSAKIWLTPMSTVVFYSVLLSL